jgi:hydrophobic/amphiphilic exporter-1 (mainly G- bacteria), HAE1 family
MSTKEGSEFRAPMAVAVIGGVISSTLLSLIVVPVFYLAIENLKGWFRRWRKRGDKEQPLLEQTSAERASPSASALT